jgi:LPXTG-motif cell wall-anchored protein
MPNRPLAAVLSALLLLSAPTAALAQSAGDDQYEDPFAGQGDPSGSGGEPTAPAAPAPDTSTAPATTSAEADASASAGEARSELPRTGAEAALIAMLGSGLLLAGTGLRLRVRADERDAG